MATYYSGKHFAATSPSAKFAARPDPHAAVSPGVEPAACPGSIATNLSSGSDIPYVFARWDCEGEVTEEEIAEMGKSRAKYPSVVAIHAHVGLVCPLIGSKAHATKVTWVTVLGGTEDECFDCIATLIGIKEGKGMDIGNVMRPVVMLGVHVVSQDRTASGSPMPDPIVWTASGSAMPDFIVSEPTSITIPTPASRVMSSHSACDADAFAASLESGMESVPDVEMGCKIPAASPGMQTIVPTLPAASHGSSVRRGRSPARASTEKQIDGDGGGIPIQFVPSHYKELPYPWPLHIKQIGRIC
jgi:hypothetical protein